MFARMTLGALYQKYIVALKEIYSKGEAAAIANMIFEHFTGFGRSAIIVKANSEVAKQISDLLNDALDKLITNIPPQYVIGETTFLKLRFRVNPHVLIPRPETEELVAEAITFLKLNSAKNVLDVGTGSGCIAVSIKKNVPAAKVFANDISFDALELTRINAHNNRTDLHFINADFLNENSRHLFPRFDLIISNPPYIPEGEKLLMDKNVVLHEPHLALFVSENDPFIFYRKIFDFSKQHLNEKGKIMLEVHENYAKETAAIFAGENYAATIKKDISGKERFVIVSHCPKR